MAQSQLEVLGLPVLPLRDVVVFPHMVIPLFVGRDKSMQALERAMEADKRILLLAQKSAETDDLQPVAIDDLLQSAVMEMYHPAQLAGVELRLHLNAKNILRTGQPLLLSLLVRNLLDNAVRYSPAGSQVDITLDAGEFRVRDNGPGIPPEEQPHVFHRYFRGSTLKHEGASFITHFCLHL